MGMIFSLSSWEEQFKIKTKVIDRNTFSKHRTVQNHTKLLSEITPKIRIALSVGPWEAEVALLPMG